MMAMGCNTENVQGATARPGLYNEPPIVLSLPKHVEQIPLKTYILLTSIPPGRAVVSLTVLLTLFRRLLYARF